MSWLDGSTVFDDDRIRLMRGDALRVLGSMDDASVDLVLADPPYSSGGMVRGDRTQSTTTKYVSTDSKAGRAIAEFTGDNRDQRAYLAWSTLWMSEAHRVLRPGRAIAVFCDWRQLPVTTDALQAGGFIWRGIGVWDKIAGRTSPGIAASRAEYVVWGTAGPLDLGHDVYLPTVMRVSMPRAERLHQTPKPVDLMSQLVQLAPPGGLVVDPFAGAGTIEVACKRMQRRCVGVELTAEHLSTAVERMKTEAAQAALVLDDDPIGGVS